MKKKKPLKPGVYIDTRSSRVARKIKQWYGSKAHIMQLGNSRFMISLLDDEIEDMDTVDRVIDRLCQNTSNYQELPS